MRGSVWAVTVLVLAPEVSFAGSADDDLAVVKKAVAEAPAKAEKVRWLKVRVVEKAGKRLSISVPLSVARALGEDWPVNVGCRKSCHNRVTLGELLRSLDAGQDLVQVESDGATVRVWVE